MITQPQPDVKTIKHVHTSSRLMKIVKTEAKSHRREDTSKLCHLKCRDGISTFSSTDERSTYKKPSLAFYRAEIKGRFYFYT